MICGKKTADENKQFYRSSVSLPGYVGDCYQISLDWCERCDFAFQNPIPRQESLDEHYASNTFASGNTLNEVGSGCAQETRVRDRLSQLLEMSGDLPARAKVLDIGAGNGTFLRSMPTSWEKSWS